MVDFVSTAPSAEKFKESQMNPIQFYMTFSEALCIYAYSLLWSYSE